MGIQKGQLALGFPIPRVLVFRECRDAAEILTSQLGKEKGSPYAGQPVHSRPQGTPMGPAAGKSPSGVETQTNNT